ncbi:MAG: cytochrome c biogenesis protein CcsA [Planctomycetales bacterium]|nr:cytochrome c biogenesis protein CcsA [Planctomycetales bacterium]MBN8627123.1 cytochrome c biogenesis protein CcsA [Planctomycetota bacterium]
MALDIQQQPELYSKSKARPTTTSNAWQTVRRVLMPVASLKLTIVLFAASIFLVFAGTLAQKEVDVWEVINHWFRVDERKLFLDDAPYFDIREFFVRIPLQYFCIDLLWPSFLGEPPKDVSLAIWFPRGWVLGALMCLNLIAAHTVRFTVQAHGKRLWGGVGVLALGGLVTYLAIQSGSSKDGVLGPAIIEWNTVWKLLLTLTSAIAFLSTVYARYAPSYRRVERISALVAAIVCFVAVGAGVYYTRTEGKSFLEPESMRILWQLLKGAAAGGILLLGCVMVFRKRAGIVLLHGGIFLIFVHEMIVGTAHKEAQMTIVEGETSNWTQDVRAPELAIVENGEKDDRVTKIPSFMLEEGKTIANERLPFDVKIVRYVPNAELRPKGPFEPTPATAGLGLSRAVIEMPRASGASSDSRVETPAAYVELLDKKNGGKSLGTYLLWVALSGPQQLPEIDGKSYGVWLRFQRDYKPYSITAKEVRADHYVASSRPKNYSSRIQVVDPTRSVDREELIKMNNPMRFAGETFYQSGYNEIGGQRITTLQVVDNVGWMLPYMACMIVGVGMLAQFGGVLGRFLDRRQRDADYAVEAQEAERQGKRPKTHEHFHVEAPRRTKGPQPATSATTGKAPGGWILPVVVGGVLLAFFGYTLKPTKPDDRGMDLAAFGKLPIAADARVKPYDALARSSLVVLSQKQTVRQPLAVGVDPDVEQKEILEGKRERRPLYPATRWLLDLMTNNPDAERYKIFRIENEDVVKALGLKTDPNLLYSWEELLTKKRPASEPDGREMLELEYQFEQLAKKNKDDSGPFERELGELETRVNSYRLLTFAFDDPAKTLSFDAEKLLDDPNALERKVGENSIRLLEMLSDSIRMKEAERKPAMAVHLDGGNWETLHDANLRRYINNPANKLQVDMLKSGIDLVMERVTELANDPGIDEASLARLRRAATAALKFNELYEARDLTKPAADSAGAQKLFAVLDAYRAGSGEKFNAAVADYRAYVEQSPPAEYDRKRSDLEAFLLRTEPFFWCSYVFLAALLFNIAAWLFRPQAMNRISLWITGITFAYYVAALVLRMYVTQRPPVVNLYSSAVFIGGTAVLLGLLVDRVYRNGIGLIAASMAGFGGLQIAHLLSRQGDTIENLQAVLDTQFWLTTHVVCITLGYMATFFAGILGVVYIARGVLTTGLDKNTGKDISRMIYGSVCFALFLSFVGTVLGGLWADDSWGRFWGWDPKENGALIIVLWNALLLHARWDGMIKDRGMAVLAVAGNITTSWSWFGVNQLGVGLHAYGFSKELRMFLSFIVIGSLVTIVVGLLPKTIWGSRKELSTT